MSSISENKNQRNVLLSQATTLVTRGLNDKTQPNYDKLMASIDDLEKTIAMQETVEEKLGKRQSQKTVETVAALDENVRKHLVTVGEIAAPAIHTTKSAEARSRVKRTLRDAFLGKDSIEVRDLTNESDAAGLALVQQLYADAIQRAATYVSPVVNLVNVVDSSKPFKLPVSDDTGRVMTAVGQPADTSTLAQDPTLFSHSTSETDALISKEYISFQTLQDAENLDDFLSKNAGEVIARTVSKGLLTGLDGAGNALANQPTGGLIAAAPKAGTTAALNALSYADITTGLFSTVNQQYFAEGTLLVSSATYQWLLAQVDSTGKALYKVHEDGILRIAGRPVYAAPELSNLGTANAPVALFGAFKRAYTYQRGSTNMLLLRETVDVNQLLAQYIIYHRFAGIAGVSNAVKALWTPAS